MAISEMKPRFKVWIEKNDEVVFGDGRLKLLTEIEKQGSISAAAKELSMSYRAAWGKIKASEERLGKKLLIIQKGGSSGGGATLTPFAKKLIGNYQSFKDKIQETTKSTFQKTFKQS